MTTYHAPIVEPGTLRVEITFGLHERCVIEGPMGYYPYGFGEIQAAVFQALDAHQRLADRWRAEAATQAVAPV